LSELKSFAWYYSAWGCARRGCRARADPSPSLRAFAAPELHPSAPAPTGSSGAELRIPSATRVVSQQLGPPRPHTPPWVRSGHPPTSAAGSPPQKPGRGEDPAPRDPLNIRGYLWQRAGVMPCWAGGSCPAGYAHPSLRASRLQTDRAQPKAKGPRSEACTHPPPPAPAGKVSMQHLPPSE